MSTPSESLEVISCSGWHEFVQCVRNSKTIYPRAFRGQRASIWPLVARLHRRQEFRDQSPEDRVQAEASLLHRFQEGCRGLPGFEQSRDWTENEWWAIAQHHGLRTPLLDWSTSPFIAAFFAYSDALENATRGNEGTGAKWFESLNEPVAVWELTLVAEEDLNRVAPGLELVRGLVDRGVRQRAQCGLFTRTSATRHPDLVTYLGEIGGTSALTKYEIPGREVARAMYDLMLMNITYATMYLDAEGVARHLNMEPYFRLTGYLGHVEEEMTRSLIGELLTFGVGPVGESAHSEGAH